MPRKPIEGNPTGIRIDLGGKEREILESITTTYRLQQLLPVVVELFSNPKKLALFYLTVGILYERLTGKKMPFIISSLDDFSETFMDYYNSLPTDYFTNLGKQFVDEFEPGDGSQNIFGNLGDSQIINQFLSLFGVDN